MSENLEQPNGDILKTKDELFKQNPDDFVYGKDIVAGVIRNKEGYLIAVHPKKRSELTQALGELTVAITKEIIKFDGIEGMTKSSIVKPHSILNFARRRR